MRLFEHLKVLGRYRLLLRDDDEDRDLATIDPHAAEETPQAQIVERVRFIF